MVSTNEPRVCVIMLNWRRSQNVLEITQAVRKSTGVKAEVWAHDNSGSLAHYLDLFDRYILSPENLGCGVRWSLVQEAANSMRFDYVAVIDDDLIFRRPGSLARACKINQVTGTRGKIFDPRKPYGRCKQTANGQVDMLLGRLIVMPADQASLTGPCPERFEDDIWACSRFTAPMIADCSLTRELDPGPRDLAVCARPGHYEAREAARRKYFRK